MRIRQTLALAFAVSAAGANAASTVSNVTVPEGFEISVAAAPPLVGHPMMGCFDDKGRLFLAESAGLNMVIEELEKATPNFIRMLEDTDGDGTFDRSTIFADKLQIPNGALWHKGSLYVAEPPGIWRFTDTDGDGIADKREHVAGKVHSNGMSSTLHGPVLDPTGRLFWCGGQSGYELDNKNADLAKARRAPGVFTLRDDGTEHEIFSLGGLANPVEVAFSPEGDVFGTVAILNKIEGQRKDGLMHWVYGGIYNLNESDPVSLPRTGETLPPLQYLGQVAPAGIARYKGAQFGEDFKNNLFFAEFNTRQVMRVKLQRSGSTFTAQAEPFVSSESIDFHATDVIEDADGSMLVIDTGGWFRHGCPTSQIAKPEVKGGIYRIRRKGAAPNKDPRGLEINWDKLSNEECVKLLSDPRPAVVEKAIEALGTMNPFPINAFRVALEKSDTVEARRNAIWASSRNSSAEARNLVRSGLKDKDASIRQAAAYACGANRDKEAVATLSALVQGEQEPAVRREAATALGRIGTKESVPALLTALGGKNDIFLRHSIIFALIQINDPQATKQGLTSSNADVQQGALLALEQMSGANLSREQVTKLLRSENFEVQKTAFLIASRRKDLHGEMVTALKSWLAKEPTATQSETVINTLASRNLPTEVEEFVGVKLAEPGGLLSAKRTLLGGIAGSKKKDLPVGWIDGIRYVLLNDASELRQQAVELVQQRKVVQLDGALKKLASEGSAADLRIAALTAVGPRLKSVEGSQLEFLKEHLRAKSSPILRLASARAISSLNLSDEQLVQFAAFLPEVDSLALPTVLRSFTRTTNEPVGLALVGALEKTPAASNLGPDTIAHIVASYPTSVSDRAKPLLQSLGADIEKQQKHLNELAGKLAAGDFKRGKEVFFGKNAACFSCHRISGQGGMVGPNLSNIGAIRNERDLLESIVYPSASVVQGYHTFEIETTDDESYTGIIIRETPEAVWIRGTDLAEVRLEMRRIKNMRESKFSIMPQGLDANLSAQELSDLVAYLKSLK